MKNFAESLRLSLTRRSLARFASALMPAFEVAPCHRVMIEHLEKLLSGKIRKLAIIAPPRHGKSLLGSVMAPAFALGRNPRETIITVSYGSDLSETWGRRVRNTLSDPAFREIFPGCQLSPDSAAVYRFETRAGGEYAAIGRGGPATGRGASLLILDDLVKDQQEANSDVVCRGIVDWLQNVAFTRLTPGGRVLAIATRWSERDPMGWILQQHGWTVLHLPAFAEAHDPLGRQPGEALWPSRYPVEVLEQIRADVGSRVFQCLYQGNAAAAQGTIFKRDWFRHYQQAPENFSRIVQSWDTAFKTGQTNDFSACATFGETLTGFYLLALYRAKIEFPTLKRVVAQQADLWRPSAILVEDKASGQSLIQELKLATSHPVIPVRIDHDKETRASAVTGYFESGRVQFPEGAAWLADLEDELASFPGGLHDDCVDAISQALNYMRGSDSWLLHLPEIYPDVFAKVRTGQVQTELYSPIEQVHQAAEQTRIATSTGFSGRRIFGEQVKPYNITAHLPQGAKPAATPKCPRCGNEGLSRACVAGPTGNIEEKCGRCGWSVVRVRASFDSAPPAAQTGCPNCGGALCRCAVSGISGDVLESCSSCGWSRTIARPATVRSSFGRA